MCIKSKSNLALLVFLLCIIGYYWYGAYRRSGSLLSWVHKFFESARSTLVNSDHDESSSTQARNPEEEHGDGDSHEQGFLSGCLAMNESAITTVKQKGKILKR